MTVFRPPVKVVFCSSPSMTKPMTYEYEPPVSVAEILGTADRDLFTVAVAGQPLSAQEIESKQLHGGELVEIIVKANAAAVPALVAAAGATAGAAFTFTAFFKALIINLAFTYLAKGLTSAGNREDSRGKAIEERPVYSVESTGNLYREFGAIPMVIGEHRVYPDLSARPYTELFEDFDMATIEGDPVTFTDVPYSPAGGPGWPNYVTAPYQIEPSPYPNGSSGQSGWVGPLLYNPASGTFMLEADFIAAGGVWTPSLAIEDSLLTYTLEPRDYDHNERLTQIFNFGWGDLAWELNEHRIVDTHVSEYKKHQLEISTLTDVGSILDNYPARSNRADEDETCYALGTGDRHWPEVVWTEPGAVLRNNPDLPDGGPADTAVNDGDQTDNEIWVRRTSPRDTVHCQIDLVGRLHRLGGAGVLPNTAEFLIEYKSDPVNGSGAQPNWTPIPGPTPANVVITNFDINEVRYPVCIDFPLADYWDVRVRQITQDSTDPNNVIEFEARSFRFQRAFVSNIFGGNIVTGSSVNYASEGYESRGQNRVGLIVQATEQLNGIVDKYNAVVKSRCWTYVGGDVWDQSLPGQSANWVWGFSKNPADWFLHMALGGYYNSGNKPFPFVGKGWHLGPHAENEELMFGGGLAHNRIDYAEIIRWRAWCAAEGLQVSAWIQNTETVYEILHKIAAVGRGSPSWYPGKLSIVWEDKDLTATAIYNVGNILLETFSVSYISAALPDTYRSTFTESLNNRYEQDYVEARRPGITGFRREVGQLDLWGVVNRQQAMRETRLEAARTLFQRRIIKFQTDIEGFHTVRGDVISIAHDVTRWAINGRARSLIMDGTNVVGLELGREEKWDGSGPLYVMARMPSGDLVQGEVVPWTGPAKEIYFTAPLWDAVDYGPGYSNQFGEEIPGVTAESLCNLGPQEYLYQIGPKQTPGKLARVIKVTPRVDGVFEMECVDEYEGLWLHDVAQEEEDWTLYNPPESGALIHPCVRGLIFHKDIKGKTWLSWEAEGASCFSVGVSVNGGQWANISGVSGTSLEIGDYDVGTNLTFSVCPEIDGVDMTPYPVGATPNELYAPACATCTVTIEDEELEAC